MLETRSLRVALLLVLTSASLSLGQVDSVCNNESLRQCDLCISASPECSWCSVLPKEIEMLMDMPLLMGYENIRCRGPDFPSSLACNESVIEPGRMEQNPQTVLKKVQDLPLSQNALEDDTITQVRPQNVSIKLRRGDTEAFNMTFISLRNTPLDVYFLTDVSSSLQFTINSLRQDILTIADSLREISSGFAIGFGSFVDKNSLPFAHQSYREYTNQFKNATRCRAFGDECVPTYVYHHSISLTNNVTHFEEVLGNVSQLSSNLDNPESSLDALLQAAVCKDVIGWRADALKMVFVVTDQNYHIAGDGKLAGIVRPNQGRCSLAKIPNNAFDEYEYTRGLEEDYVSVWQIRDALERNRIVATFVLQFDFRCVENMCPDPTPLRTSYEGLLTEFSSSTISQVQVFNSSNRTTITQELINVIQGAYNRTVQSVQVATPTNIEGYSISITPVEGCRVDPDRPEACRVDFDDTVTFSVSITLENCSAAQRFRHQLIGGPYEFTFIDVEPLCTCECSSLRISDESVCTMGQGDQVCGVCECDDPYSGPECQCTEGGRCSSSADCNGYVCDVCGFCDCNGTAFGDNCECNATNNPCETFVGNNPIRNMDEICSGPERGICSCEQGKCICGRAPMSNVSYFGTGGTADAPAADNNCACDPDNCYNPDFPNGICYDQVSGIYIEGRCGCDGCDCSQIGFRYRNTCTNTAQLCGQLSTCVRCYLTANPCAEPPCPVTDCPDSGTACRDNTFEQLRDNEVMTGVPEGYQDTCTIDFEGCEVEFYFSTSGNDPVLIENSNEYSCPASAVPWIIAGSLVGAILLLGLLALIILKICLVFLERVEYRKFTQELKDADFAPHENPLYITPQQDYQNPIRRSSTRRSQ